MLTGGEEHEPGFIWADSAGAARWRSSGWLVRSLRWAEAARWEVEPWRGVSLFWQKKFEGGLVGQ